MTRPKTDRRRCDCTECMEWPRICLRKWKGHD
jgi:hypothetical protein